MDPRLSDLPGILGLPQADTEVSRDTLVQLFCLPRRGQSAAGMNTEEPESADEHCLSELEPSVPVRWACRTGVCHSCESGFISGAVVYAPEPLDKPADGNLLVCCSQPINDVVVDL
jgi:hypothetical protein